MNTTNAAFIINLLFPSLSNIYCFCLLFIFFVASLYIDSSFSLTLSSSSCLHCAVVGTCRREDEVLGWLLLWEDMYPEWRDIQGWWCLDRWMQKLHLFSKFMYCQDRMTWFCLGGNLNKRWLFELQAQGPFTMTAIFSDKATGSHSFQ